MAALEGDSFSAVGDEPVVVGSGSQFFDIQNFGVKGASLFWEASQKFRQRLSQLSLPIFRFPQIRGGEPK